MENPSFPVENPGFPVENPSFPVENPGFPIEKKSVQWKSLYYLAFHLKTLIFQLKWAFKSISLPAILIIGHNIALVFNASDRSVISMSGRVNFIHGVIRFASTIQMFRTVIPEKAHAHFP